MSSKRVLVVGAGYTGGRLVNRLDNPVALGRSATGEDRIDLDDDYGRPVTVSHDDAIVYTVPPSRDHDNDIRLERFLERLTTPPKRFVYLSTTGVYGDHGGRAVDETTHTAPRTERAARRASAEEALNTWCGDRGSTLVVLRVPGIYGPGRLGLERIRSGGPYIRESEANPGNRIHVDDLVACCLAALEGEDVSGTFNVGDGDHRSSTWFAMEVARQASLPPPATASRETVLAATSPAGRSFLAESRRVDVSRMRNVLKPALVFENPVDGIAAALEATDRD